MSEWVRVYWQDELPACPCCGEPYCPICDDHHADCECPGPTSDGYEFKEVDGVLYARKL